MSSNDFKMDNLASLETHDTTYTEGNRVPHQTINISKVSFSRLHNYERLQQKCLWSNDRISPEVEHACVGRKLSAFCKLGQGATLLLQLSRSNRSICKRKLFYQTWGHLGCNHRNSNTICSKKVLLIYYRNCLHVYCGYVSSRHHPPTTQSSTCRVINLYVRMNRQLNFHLLVWITFRECFNWYSNIIWKEVSSRSERYLTLIILSEIEFSYHLI